jgi:hypothetical protein
MKNLWIAGILAAACAASLAKIPAPVLDDAAKAKAAEAAAKAAWQGKVEAYQLCKVQDRVAAYYRSHVGKDVKPPALHPAAASASSASSPTPAVAGGTAATAAGPATPTPCADPGVFAFNAPSEKPLETSGAHSPAGNATSPPSNRATSAEMAPAKK